jgi:hypothetical protein
MASTFSPNLRIELIAVGEQANTWGGTTNTNLGTLLEQAITGGVSIDVTAGNVTLTALDGASDQSRPMVIIAIGTPGVTRTITAPAKGKVYIVYNNSGSSLNFIASGGAGVTLVNQAKKFIYCDSVNFYEAINALTVTSGTIDGTTIGATAATTGKFTTVQSTVTTGTAPFIVASTTAVANLTASNVTTNANLTGGVTSVGNAATVVTNANLTGGVTSVGNAATVVTNANLSGAVTSVGNVTSLGSFTSAQLATALTNETGSGSAVFSISPTFTGTVNTAALTAAGAVTITGANALRGSYGAGADTNSFAAGDRALDSNTTGGSNTAVGVDALTANTQGGENVAVGFYSLKSNTIGVYNVGVGSSALTANTTGDNNTALGSFTLASNTTGATNVAVGIQSLNSNTTGSDNIAVGYNALSSTTIGTYNTAVGSLALTSNISGSFNTAVGDYSLSNVSSGSYNTAVGDDTGLNLTTGSYNQVFGNGITLGAASTGRIGIGSLFTHPTNNAVVIGNGTNRISNSYTVNATWAFSSDERIKNVIGKDTLGLSFINDLEPVTYRWKPSNEIPKELTAHYAEENVQDTNIVMHGLIAQNVKSALDKAGVDTFTGWSEDEDGTQRLGMADLITPMINAIKELTARLETLEGKL